jgi:hypothetical protein
MKSPFPGMDPFLEPHGLDVHASLAAGSRDSLNEQLPEDLVASVQERVIVEDEGGQGYRFGPDVRVFEPRTKPTGAAAGPPASPGLISPRFSC